MDFRKYASRETSELVGRLVTGASDKVASDLQALRQAFDAVTGALDTALASQAAPEYVEEVAALADRLAAEAAARAEAAGAEARRQAQASIDELRAALEQARAERTATAEELRAAREQLGAARDEASRAAAQRDAEAARSEKLSAALSAVTTELQDTKAQNKTLLERNSALAAELEAFTKRSAADLAALKKSAAADIDALKKSSEEHERAARAQQAKLDAAQATMDAAQGKQEAAVREAESRQVERAAGEHRATCDRAAAFFETALDRLMALGVCSSDDATMDGALNAMVEALSAQFPRVALFRVQGNRLEGVCHVGFDLQSDISQVLIPRNLDSLATQAVASARIETRSGTNLAETTGMPFGGSPQFALALPLMTDGEPIAVLYADDSDQADRDFARPDVRIKYAELLRQQALPLLERLAAKARTLAELDEYAALLLTELEQTYAAEIASAADLSETDRRKHLRENIDYARRLYAERAGSEGPRAASLFEQRLVAAVERGADTPFGRDISAAIGARRRAARAVASAGEKQSAAS